jgi:CrcB protein
LNVVLVFLGGCVGAVARYATDRFISARHDMVFPWGTFAVNMAGSAILGAVAGAAPPADHWVVLLVGTGFCGALTTFSTFSLETFRLLEDGSVLAAGLNVVTSVAVGLGCVIAGYQLAHLLR